VKILRIPGEWKDVIAGFGGFLEEIRYGTGAAKRHGYCDCE
jgi:hypothetical protein